MKPNHKKCLRCDYDWTARVKRPKQCPLCKSLKWNVPEKKS
jgi:predicted Zn-ribbon and HTH transcriptional regulator